MSERMSAQEYRSLLSQGRGNKHHAQRSEYGGRVYASKLEAAIARRLDFLLRASLLEAWEYEYRFILPGLTPTGKRKLTHKVDFLVKTKSGRHLYLEAKGQRHRDGETRRAWVESEYKINIHVVGSVTEAESVILEAEKI